MSKSDKLLYAKLSKLGLFILTIVILLSSFVKLAQINNEKTTACIEAGYHNEEFCRTGEGPRY